jgi:hypothetical protein
VPSVCSTATGRLMLSNQSRTVDSGWFPTFNLPETVESHPSLHRASDWNKYFENIKQWKIYIRFRNWNVHTRCDSEIYCTCWQIMALVSNINHYNRKNIYMLWKYRPAIPSPVPQTVSDTTTGSFIHKHNMNTKAIFSCTNDTPTTYKCDAI